MPLTHLPATSRPRAIARVLREEGAVIVDRLAPPELMDRIAVELAPSLAATPMGTDEFTGYQTRRTGALIARSVACREFVQHPVSLATARVVLAHGTNFRLHLTQAIAIGPGAPAQLIHRDQWAFDFFPFPPGFEVQFNAIWAQNDFTDANGATRVVIGSNQATDGLTFDLLDTEPAEMERGSVLFYTGSVYHGGGANHTDGVRIAVNINYTLAWLRQAENQYLSVPREVAETLPDDLLRLMGYERGAYALGHIDDMRDPIEAVRPGTGTFGLDLSAESRAVRR